MMSADSPDQRPKRPHGLPRLAMIAGATLVVLVAITLGVLYHLLDVSINTDRGRPQVLAAPPHVLEPEILAPYRGLHPRWAQRPEETFDFPIELGEVGPVEPLYAKVRAYPMLCRTVDSNLGQPVVDNQDGYGMAVFAENADGSPTDQIVGYSKDCSLRTRVEYWHLPAAETPEAIKPASGPGGHGLTIRVEIGTINRHIYQIFIPAGPYDQPAAPDLSAWNGRLIYQFRGGVGIGLRQGRAPVERIIDRRAEQLRSGYAVAYSTANQTSNSYNLALAEDTLARVKRQFETAYAVPVYTVGIGGSGGALQQYLIAQNRPGLLDAAVPLYSFPDMVTQSIYVLDCEPLSRYFDEGSSEPDFWADVRRRSAVLGLGSSTSLQQRFYWFARGAELARGQWPRLNQGSTECSRSWRGMTPVVLNPHYAHFSDRFVPELRSRVRWTYWGDLKYYYGTTPKGYGRVTWDNVGVQYGLKALRDGRIRPEQFLELNRRVGGWRDPAAMEPVQLWLFDAAPSSLSEFSAGDYRNLTAAHSDWREVAPRSRGDLEAIRAAYRSGQVFLGRADIPIIDLRHYLEPELDMHHAVSSFAARLRLQRAAGHAGNQLIWMTRPPDLPYAKALDLIDRWVLAIQANPERGVADNKPPDGLDRCWSSDHHLIAEGDGVWDGAWNGREDGTCMKVYPILSTSRIEAGGPYTDDIFKCVLQPVDAAIEAGLYEPVDMRSYRDQLAVIFPDGVCDYRQPDVGLPPELASWYRDEDEQEAPPVAAPD